MATRNPAIGFLTCATMMFSSYYILEWTKKKTDTTVNTWLMPGWVISSLIVFSLFSSVNSMSMDDLENPATAKYISMVYILVIVTISVSSMIMYYEW